jgi:4-amino-4-deoxy-L-arabinose transferase-like glycosyltransferase
MRVERSGRRVAVEMSVLLAVVVGALAAFLDKAFSIDDPLFLWLARHLQSRPLDFFGFDVNWYGASMPMYQVTKNPPLGGYYLAGAAAIVGWSERALHAAFLLPAAGAAAATYLLARRLCTTPLEATLVGLLTPVFLVSSTSVMCDTLMLALWCGAVVLWLRGFDRGSAVAHAAAAFLAALAVLAKYFAAALVPLLFAYGLVRQRRLGAWALWLLVPIAAMAGYELSTRALYGVGLLSDAASYAASFDQAAPQGLRVQLLEGLVYAGGCLLPALCFAPLCFPRWASAAGLVLAASALLLARGRTWPFVGETFAHYESPEWVLSAQICLLALGGVAVVALAAGELVRRRDAESRLLALWLLGTLAFAVSVNWVNNGRSNLPMVPVLGIAIARRLDALAAAGRPRPAALRLAAALPAIAVALAETWADWRWANDVRATAAAISERHRSEGTTVWFYGHWGFQLYMESHGATAIDRRRDVARAGDLIVRPDNNVFVGEREHPGAELVEVVRRPAPRFVRTLARLTGAAFYASNMGSLPFVFGRMLPDHYQVWRVLPGREIDL